MTGRGRGRGGGGGGGGHGHGHARQATLFQAWGRRPEEEEEEAEEEALLAAAAAEAEAEEASASSPGPAARGFVGGAAGSVWLFPRGRDQGLEERAYQVRAARAALGANTLLCLPTGLGKTLVAAVVLLNFYRWFPGGKALFLAPTKPLVAQQRRACARLAAIPAAHMAEITGGTQIADRKEMWRNKRVFFLTPQVMVNDLSRGICPAAEVKCLVLDEAHKALGNYAYCQVVKELCKYTQEFRILALTATPGSDTKAVQQVITNLLISHIELCSEDSPDIQPYSYERQVEKCVVPLGKELGDIQNAYIQVLEAFAGRLIRLRVLSQREIPSLTKYQIILARDQFRKNPPSHCVGMQQGVIEGDFALCISLYHGYELLLQMGTRSLFLFLSGIMDGSKGMTRAKNELARNEDFVKLYSQLESMFSDTAVTSANGNHPNIGTGNRKPFIYSHPKLKKLEEVVTEHFRSWKEHGDQKIPEGRPAGTRVMIFSSFRDSVQEIAEMLSQHYPAVRVMTFVGHSTGKSTKGFTQKEQLEVVKRFREGGYNTLVSTCVGEEGLDIGEVDLIVCFDAQKSPIRLVQRMGRTGRKRQGRIVVLLSEGREERTYNQSQSNRRNLLKALSENKGLQFYQHSPRMIPEGLDPQMHRMLIMPAEGEPGTSEPASKERRGHTRLLKGIPYASGPGAKPSRPPESWCLTEEEFGRWERLYRLEAGDGIRKVVLPRGHFETLEEEEEEEEEVVSRDQETHQLSLTEWRLWQNRPFPTFLVDHSDRCRHFVSVMELIEEMRQEEDNCSYEQKLQPFFHWEDVEASDPQRSKRSPEGGAPQRPSAGKGSLWAGASKAKSRLSSPEALDAETVSLFKATSFRSARRPPALGVETTGQQDPGPPPALFSASRSPSVEGSGRERRPKENGEDPEDSLSRSARPERTPLRECQPALQQSGCGTDPVSPSWAEDSSLQSSSLFYFPAGETGSWVPAETEAEEDPAWRERLLMSVTKLLSRSPPSLEEILPFEEKREGEGEPFRAVGERAFRVTAGPLAPEESSGPPPQGPPEFTSTHEWRTSSHPLEAKSTPEASLSKISDLNWDELFEDDSQEQIGVHGESPPVAHQGLYVVDPLGKEDGGGDRGAWERLGGETSAGEKAAPLSERDRFPEADPVSPDGEGGRPAVSPDVCHPGGNPEETGGSQPSDGLAAAKRATPTPSWMVQRDGPLRRAAGETSLPPLQELFDASQDLFSVNFDLGFSLQESEEETSGQGSPVNGGNRHRHGATPPPVSPGWSLPRGTGRTSPSTSSSECVDGTKFSTPLPLKSHHSGPSAAGHVIPGVSPLTPAGEKRCRTPDSSQSVFATPTGRWKTPRRGGSRGRSLGSLAGQREEGPQRPPLPGRASGSLLKVLANSAFETEAPASHEAWKTGRNGGNGSHVLLSAGGASSESEEEIIFLRKNKRKRNILTSPEITPKMNSGDFESPVHPIKKQRRPIIVSDPSSDESDVDLAEKPKPPLGGSKDRDGKPGRGDKKRGKRRESGANEAAAKHFMDDEAEVSAHGASEVSSDESSEHELSSSLVQFLNDETEIMQDLNESEMQAVYLKSVRSPAVGNRYKMVHKRRSLTPVFSQVPEQDENYLADSFCVEDLEEGNPKSGSSGEEEEEEEEECLDFNLLQEESFANGRKQYNTRHRRRLRERGQSIPARPRRPSRVVSLLSSSSDEEGGFGSGGPRDLPSVPKAGNSLPTSGGFLPRRMPAPKAAFPRLPQAAGACVPPEPEGGLSEEPGPEPDWREPFPGALKGESEERPPGPRPLPASRPSRDAPRTPAALCVLVDSREVASGPEVISSLKAVHGIKVQVVSLGVCDYVVSNRLAVERKTQAELLNGAQQSKAVRRVQRLKSTFERICVIVEKERPKAGEAWRAFHRTKRYDSILSAFIRAGIRVLFSSCQEETAELLAGLASVERRKKAALVAPTEVEGPQREALRFYLSIPCVSYPLALAFCHCFGSVKEMVNSSPAEMAARTQVTQQKAEEVYRYIYYHFEATMLPGIGT
uniref:Fanconi anemia group M protein isoform X2 n=1 Tax=Pogona vitticeps TaxID=103695 RepID=A0ABM5FCA9_9SAUR